MNLSSHLLQRLFKLGPPLTRDVDVQRDLRVPMPDGVELLADLWTPRTGEKNLPIALVRSSYGRAGFTGLGFARPLAERGYQVLVQSVRGTFGSGGVFDPMRQERDDGLATVDWLIEQPWFGGSIVLVGASYLGHVQWAIADQLPPQVKAMIPQVTESAHTMEFLRKDGFSLETPFGWGIQVDAQEQRWAILRGALGGRKKARALATLPLGDADVAINGHHVPYIQDILTCTADAPRWTGIDHSHRVANVTVPVSSVGGWYDIFLPGQLRDFTILQDAGRRPRLTVGPWTHINFDGTAIQEAIDFGLAHARGQEPPARAPVRLYVMGDEKWRDFDHWPPNGYTSQEFYLHPAGALSTHTPPESDPDHYRYDPADPTPAVGGVRMTRDSGKVDNTKLEARRDVLTYTTDTLETDVEVIGDVNAHIWFSSSLPYADVFVRLCDVTPQGRSYNVCDGLTSLTDADELQSVSVMMWPTAYRFKRGHRIRIQVSSGAFPRYARNPGTGESHATATVLRAADQTIYHDPLHRSAVLLPVKTVP